MPVVGVGAGRNLAIGDHGNTVIGGHYGGAGPPVETSS